MLDELAFYPSVQVRLINTSPGLDVRNKMTGFNLEKVKRSLSILPRYIYEIPHCDLVLVFANDLFAITLAPLLLFVARLFHKPFLPQAGRSRFGLVHQQAEWTIPKVPIGCIALHQRHSDTDPVAQG